MKKILILYTELAGYTVASINTLAKIFPTQIMVIRWELNAEAPFNFHFESNVKVVTRTEYSEEVLYKMAIDFQADALSVSGWADKLYLKISQNYKEKGVPTIVMSDNPWKNTLRQKIAALTSSFYIKKYFSHFWCAGIEQYEFARRMGYGINQILMHFYSANTALFKKEDILAKRKYPKTIIYCGRFLELKGAWDLYQAFRQYQIENPQSEWKLLMIGNGPLKEKMIPNEKLEVSDFLQPEEVAAIIKEVGVFCMPSRKDNWGVALHEATLAACPVIVSDIVSARTAFVRYGYNGYIFKSENIDSIKNAIKRITEKSEDELRIMGQHSAELSLQITPEIWANTLMSVLERG